MTKPLSGLLWGLSQVYGTGVSLRHVLYDRGWFQQERVSAVVVSVGNIVCGGAGKTPLVKMLAQKLAKTTSVAIVTRGYRSQAEKQPGGLRISSDELPSSEICGDEPYLLAKALPGVPVFVGRDRVTSARKAIREGAEVLLLDDGMQHRRIRRDLELVVMDGRDLFGQGYLLPRGRLRDHLYRLKEADALFVNHISTEEAFEAAKIALKEYSDAPVIGMGYRVEKREGCKVGLFCALGRPERFVESVEAKGYEVVAKQFALDHRPFDLKQLDRFTKHSLEAGAQKLVCSEKDAVKLPNIDGFALPVEVIAGELEIRFGHEHFKKILTRVGVCQKRSR